MQILQNTILILLLASPLGAIAQEWQAKSTDHHTALLEMFVSEGCGLCPAAEHYVNHLPEKGITDDELIVLTFHIDYLNSKKGWVDKFAKPTFSERQIQLAHLNRYENIFTPELVVSGETVHSWEEQLIDVVGFLNHYKSEADISLNIEQKTSDNLIVDVSLQLRGEENREFSKLYLAVTEDDVFSEVRGGDNAGRDFNHQNLVRTWLGPFDLATDGSTNIQQEISLADDWQQTSLTVVAVVQNLSDGYVLQALAVPLER
ncbi:DUF1223 domain-containing protein [Methylophaga sp. OBS3]|uniref:DUF1223 domain-containing protein n=1 Tax=Methylophaga sp. OBS3 TaxID=2991934 RepID=UPI002257644B|nr:DUF1223 domain-containing protein [Methylophaga sp. OBS3]MCX4189144.1 DUF1223 domain-containing protein [Methylophaga sp. OBS3]